MSPSQPNQPAWTRLWQGRDHFSVLDTGGSGHPGWGVAGFLHLWQTWRHDHPGRCGRLHAVLLCDDPAQAELARREANAPGGSLDHDLLAQFQALWPPLTPNLHPLELDGGQVHLLLALGPLHQVLPRLRLQADVVGLAGAAIQTPVHRLRVLKALGRLAAPGAVACGARASPELLAELRTAGFMQDTQAPPGRIWAAHRPYARRLPAAARMGTEPSAALVGSEPPRTAVVIGAGVAGAAVAQALAQQGLRVTVLDRHAQPAAETSGNPAALFHGTVNPDDGLYARLFRAAALVAQRVYVAACAARAGQASVDGQVQGLLRLQPTEARAEDQVVQLMRAQLQRLALPPTYVQALDTAEASARAGRPLALPAWFYPGGGWIDPAAWVRQALCSPGVQFKGDSAVQALRRQHGQWQTLDGQGRLLAQADVLVLACATQSQALLKALAPALHWPQRQTRGQVTQLHAGESPRPGCGGIGPLSQPLRQPLGQALGQALALPVAGDGYALALSAPGVVLCGATRQAAPLHDRPGPFVPHPDTGREDDLKTGMPRQADHQLNLQRLQRLTGLRPRPDSTLQGRVGWRLHSDDRLPIAGPVPLLDSLADKAWGGGSPPRAAVRMDQARHWPRCAGLFVLTALGARGLTLAPLLGRLVAAQATGTPWPLEQELADAVDPVRWALRAARRHQAQTQTQTQTQTQAAARARSEPEGKSDRSQDAG